MASPKTSLSGQQFGRLKAIASPYRSTQGKVVNTACACGKQKPIHVANLLSGRTKSCGCLPHEVTNILESGGLAAQRAYKAFHSMRQKVTNPKSTLFPACGGTGVKICEAWTYDFTRFWKDMGAPPPGHILSRLNTAGDFTPENCRWTTYREGQSFYRPRTKAA